MANPTAMAAPRADVKAVVTLLERCQGVLRDDEWDALPEGERDAFTQLRALADDLDVPAGADGEQLLLLTREPDPRRHACDGDHPETVPAAWYVEAPAPGRYLPSVRWSCYACLQRFCAELVVELAVDRPPADPAPADRPTDAEREILQALADGGTVKEIARRLYLSSAGVSMRITRYRERAGLDTTVAATVAHALRRGWIR